MPGGRGFRSLQRLGSGFNRIPSWAAAQTKISSPANENAANAPSSSFVILVGTVAKTSAKALGIQNTHLARMNALEIKTALELPLISDLTRYFWPMFNVHKRDRRRVNRLNFSDHVESYFPALMTL